MNQQPKATLESFLSAIETRRIKHEESQRLLRKEKEDKKLARIRPWWLDAAQ